MQVRVIGETKLIRGGAYWRESVGRQFGGLRGFTYHHGFDGSEEYEGLRLVLGIAIAKRYVVVGYFDHITLVHTTGDTLDVHKLTFITPKQVFRVLSFHLNTA